MVNRVGDGPGYNYPQVNERKVNSGASGAGEKFQLDYSKEGAIYEPSSEAQKKLQEDKKIATHGSGSSKTDEEGVRLTLTGTYPNRQEEANKADEPRNDGMLNTVTDIVKKAINAIKDFFRSIWEDAPAAEKQEVAGDNEFSTENDQIVSKPKTRFEQAKADAEAFLASAEGKKVARNSDLLTYYDKHGTVVSMSPSDKQRILYGDKNQIEV